ncbi:hypothetical protein [Hymenobacter guriensis]|uniref:STAS/SEC14 domain-containing protein n=1 Tax=Hymenobacter guriensis TaxID=2793065 RepID=A0ABS0L2L8_9BACT|nr:hypothetical protein [Hymenobacter guriensis]MBG8554344.1 hypothetical protein [Hymenobacter guriensis]
MLNLFDRREKPYYQNTAGQVAYSPAGYVQLNWSSERISLTDMQQLYEQALQLLRSTRVGKVVSEHGQRQPLSAEAQTWITQNWIPRAMQESNTHYCAIVEGHNPLHRLATQTIVSNAPAGFHFQRFGTLREAAAWLQSLG